MPKGFGGGRGQGWWHSRFRGCGYRVTTARETVLDVLSKTSRHLSAEEIYLQVRKVYPGSGLATVYRTLELLTQMGLILKFDFGDGRARYEMVRGTEQGSTHHHHLICLKCKRIINYSDFLEEEVSFLKKIEKSLSEKYRFKIKKHILQFYGLCEKCSG